MQTRNISTQIIKAIAACFTRTVKIDPVEPLHDLHMIGHLKRWNCRFSKAFNLNILAVVPADRHRWIDNIRDHHHPLADLCFKLRFKLLKLLKLFCHRSYLRFGLFGLLAQTLAHQSADLFADGIALCAQIIAARLCLPELLVAFKYFVDQRQFFLLKFFSDIFPDCIRISPDKFNIEHLSTPFPLF